MVDLCPVLCLTRRSLNVRSLFILLIAIDGILEGLISSLNRCPYKAIFVASTLSSFPLEIPNDFLISNPGIKEKRMSFLSKK